MPIIVHRAALASPSALPPMAIGKRRRPAKQASMWVATQALPRSAAHPFYTRLNQISDEDQVETRQASPARARIAPVRYRKTWTLGGKSQDTKMLCLVAQLSIQPCPRQAPFTLDGAR